MKIKNEETLVIIFFKFDLTLVLTRSDDLLLFCIPCVRLKESVSESTHTFVSVLVVVTNHLVDRLTSFIQSTRPGILLLFIISGQVNSVI